MRTFEDNGIKWINISKYESGRNPLFRQYINIIDTWSNNEPIKKYIYDGKVGHELESLFKLFNTNIHFATIDDQLVAVMLTSSHQPLTHFEELKEYIKSGRHSEDITSDISEEFLTKQETNVIIDSKDENNLYIEYLVVNPDLHGKGIGTRIFKSIKENPVFFNNNYTDVSFIQTAIHNENIPSRKTVIKNGFKRIKPHKDPLPYSVYYFQLQNQTHSKEK